MKPWMFAALLGALFGLTSRHWLSVDVGHGHMIDGPAKRVHVHVIVGIGNRIIYNPAPRSASSEESSHAEGA